MYLNIKDLSVQIYGNATITGCNFPSKIRKKTTKNFQIFLNGQVWFQQKKASQVLKDL